MVVKMESTKWNPLESKPNFVECETTLNVEFKLVSGYMVKNE